MPGGTKNPLSSSLCFLSPEEKGVIHQDNPTFSAFLSKNGQMLSAILLFLIQKNPAASAFSNKLLLLEAPPPRPLAYWLDHLVY